jgi:hypothetical protein
LSARDCCTNRLKAKFFGKASSLSRFLTDADIIHSNELGDLSFDLKSFSTACIIMSSTNPASMPLVVATQLMITLSQQSSANDTLTRSLLSQGSSNPSEHQRVSLSLAAL